MKIILILKNDDNSGNKVDENSNNKVNNEESLPKEEIKIENPVHTNMDSMHTTVSMDLTHKIDESLNLKTEENVKPEYETVPHSNDTTSNKESKINEISESKHTFNDEQPRKEEDAQNIRTDVRASSFSDSGRVSFSGDKRHEEEQNTLYVNRNADPIINDNVQHSFLFKDDNYKDNPYNISPDKKTSFIENKEHVVPVQEEPTKEEVHEIPHTKEEIHEIPHTKEETHEEPHTKEEIHEITHPKEEIHEIPKEEIHELPKEEIHVAAHHIKEEIHEVTPHIKEEIHETTPHIKEEIHEATPHIKEEIHDATPHIKEEIHEIQSHHNQNEIIHEEHKNAEITHDKKEETHPTNEFNIIHDNKEHIVEHTVHVDQGKHAENGNVIHDNNQISVATALPNAEANTGEHNNEYVPQASGVNTIQDNTTASQSIDSKNAEVPNSIKPNKPSRPMTKTAETVSVPSSNNGQVVAAERKISEEKKIDETNLLNPNGNLKSSPSKKDTSASEKMDKFSNVPNSFSEEKRTSDGVPVKSANVIVKTEDIRLVDKIDIDKDKDENLENIRRNNSNYDEGVPKKERKGFCTNCIIY